MKLMIFTATWMTPQGSAMQECTRSSIEMQTVLCPSPSTASTASTGSATEAEWVIGTDNPHPIGRYLNVLHQYRRAREMFLAGNYEALLAVEHDNVLPDEGAAQRLLDTDADVVYGVYVFRQGPHALSAWRYEGDEALGKPLNKFPLEMRDARKAGAWRVCGVGFGCTLFRRHVLEQIDFRGGGLREDGAPDLPFAVDALKAGYISMARFDVRVGHVLGGRMLFPYGEGA